MTPQATLGVREVLPSVKCREGHDMVGKAPFAPGAAGRDLLMRLGPASPPPVRSRAERTPSNTWGPSSRPVPATWLSGAPGQDGLVPKAAGLGPRVVVGHAPLRAWDRHPGQSEPSGTGRAPEAVLPWAMAGPCPWPSWGPGRARRGPSDPADRGPEGSGLAALPGPLGGSE